ncbi:MAG: 4-(cytidine 5-diphospho)-2-C-methyl-D-erythritol kinase [Verrucomicrobiota bacterium]|jgi:4-diphosphocytidyl-2-C-methyl-D-erythritol kinase
MRGNTLHLTSPAKINLWLRILAKRPDGFHEIETRMYPINITDDVLLTVGDAVESTLSCSDPSLPTDDSNLALKALRSFEARTGIRKSWQIHLEKRIPHGAGLGGGSSNAAAVFLGLNQLCDSPLSLSELSELAAQLGSDIPFFLYKSVCDASGRGETITPVSNFEQPLHLVLIKPPFGISTPWAYKGWADSSPLMGVPYEPQTTPWGKMVNDLERPVFEKWLMLPALKKWLLEQSETRAALMSGSGSTMFAITGSESDSRILAAKAGEFCGESTWVKVAQTL